jgi:hypothetical protein
MVALVCLLVTLAFTVQAANSGFQKAEVLSITSGQGLDENPGHRSAVFTVQISDVIYTGSGKRIKHQTDDYSEGLNAGDIVEAAISGGEMIIRKPNGGEIKTRIVKRERAQ